MGNELQNEICDTETVTISKTEYNALKAQCSELEEKVQWLMEQIHLARHRQFGSSSEKSEYDQMSLFNETEFWSDEKTPEPNIETVKEYRRKKATSSEGRLPPDLPVEVVEHTPPEEEQICPQCGAQMQVIGKEVRDTLKIIPEKVVIVRDIAYTYACRNCEKNDIAVPVVKAEMPKPLIKGSFITPEAVAYIMIKKFVSGVPLYRQEQELEREGIPLSRQTMSNWLLKCTENYLVPIYTRLHEQLCEREVLHADETTLQVLKEPGKSAQSKSYMWLYRTSGDAKAPIVLYEYQPDRKGKRPKEFLSGFKGYLHTDGYAGYHAELPADIIVVGCWAHCRRTFHEALKVLKKEDQPGSLAAQGKAFCDSLFEIEKALKDVSPDERKQKRLELAKPVLDTFLAWLHVQEHKVVPKSGIGKAVYYALTQWKYLERYLLDGRLEISNNRAERSIKPFVIDRKNFLFCNTPRGAQASAVMFSLIETAKENDLNPYAYLTYVLQTAHHLDLSDPKQIEMLLPEKAPENCRVPKVALIQYP